MARAIPPSGPDSGNPPDDTRAKPTTWDVELLHVLVTRKGTQVDAQWGIHPQLKHDLWSEEWKEVADLMAKVTHIVGTRFSEVLSTVEPDPPGQA